MQDDPKIAIRTVFQQSSTDQNQDALIRMSKCLRNAFSSILELWEPAVLNKGPQSQTMVSEFEDLSWTVPVHPSCDQGLARRHKGLLRLTCPIAEGWQPPKSKLELHAMLSMWLRTLDGLHKRNNPPYLRVLGHWSKYSLASLESLPRWIGGSLAVEPIPRTSREHNFFGSHRVNYASVDDELLFGLSLNAHRK
jgi:hypothetical protein